MVRQIHSFKLILLAVVTIFLSFPVTHNETSVYNLIYDF